MIALRTLLYGGLLLFLCVACRQEKAPEEEILATTIEGGDTTATTTELQYLELDLPDRNYLVFRQELSFRDINGFLAMESKALRETATTAGIPTGGPYAVLTYEWDTERGWADCAVALPVAADTKLDPYVNITLPATKALALDLRGPYSAISAYHVALDQELRRRGLEATLPSIESYTVGPPEETDPANFVTRIIYPYKSAR
ncbi:MAG: GyrI-like domain-containing protein [Bacteroidota bacterium]